MTDRVAEFLAGVPVEVDPQEIECRLSALWKPASEELGGEGAVVRACIANIVVFSPGEEDLARADEVVTQVSRRHPSRTLFLVCERSATPGGGDASRREEAVDGRGEREEEEAAEAEVLSRPEGAAGGAPVRPRRLRATISAVCHAPAPGVAAVCCERIRLFARPEDAELFAGAVSPLLVPDIPTCVWWRGALDHPLLARLATEADKVVVDSRRLADGGRALASIAELLARRDVTDVIDLAWRAASPWRRAIADSFDEPAVAELLPRISLVELDHDGDPGAATAPVGTAALLAGWLVSRLGWEPVSTRREGGERLVTCRRPGGATGTVLLRACGPTGRDGGLRGETRAVRLLDGAAREEAAVAVEVVPGSPESARATYATRRFCSLPRILPLPALDDVALLGGVLDSPIYTGVFRGALAAAIALLGLTEA